MGELTIIEKSAEVKANEAKKIRVMESLPVSQQPFIMATMANKLIEMEPIDAGKEIYLILKVAEMDSGLTKLHDDDIKVLAKSAYDLMKVNYRGLTVAEFRTACKNGVVGMYEEWYGFCLKTVVQWIEGYLTNDARKNAILEWNAKLDRAEISTELKAAKIEFNYKKCIEAFNSYKLTKQMPNAAFCYYDVINEALGTIYNGKKTLITDTETRKKIVTECEEIHGKMAMGLKKKSEANGNFAEAEKLIEVIIDPKGQKTLERMIKGAFLKQYFNQLIESGKEMEL